MSEPAPLPIEASELARLERLLIALSARFISLPPSEVDAAIDQAVKAVVMAIDIDRCALVRVLPEQRAFVRVSAWTSEGLRPAVLAEPVTTYPWSLARLEQGESIIFSSAEELPPEAAGDKAAYTGNYSDISFVSMPLLVAGSLLGALNFLSLARRRTWPPELLDRLRLVAEIFANALSRKRVQQELEQMLAFEQMVTDITASLVSLRPNEVDRVIESGLERTARFLEMGRATLWVLSDDRRSMLPTHHWVDAGTLRSPSVGAQDLPWVVDRLSRGSAVRLRHLGELPAEAGRDRATLEALHTVSILAVPLRISGTVVGAFALDTLTAGRSWSDAFVPRVRLLGEVFATALARKESDRRLAEAQAEAAQHRERLAHLVRLHTVGEMSAGIAHEISQPLVAIENYALAAGRHAAVPGRPDIAKVSELLGKIVTQSSRAGEVMRKLRSMVQRHEFEMKRVDAGRIVRESLQFAEMEGHLHEVAIELCVADGLPDVLADAIQIQQVIVNLVRNASDALAQMSVDAPRQLRIDVGVRPDACVCVRVADSGPGFATGDIDQIFQPFFSTKSAGLGVGLSLCRTIVEAHGGRLDAHPGDAGGAVFEFTLPCADEVAS